MLGYEEQPLVSTDYINDTRSGIVDALSTMVVDKTHLKMYVWYDNEYQYSARMEAPRAWSSPAAISAGYALALAERSAAARAKNSRRRCDALEARAGIARIQTVHTKLRDILTVEHVSFRVFVSSFTVKYGSGRANHRVCGPLDVPFSCRSLFSASRTESAIRSRTWLISHTRAAHSPPAAASSASPISASTVVSFSGPPNSNALSTVPPPVKR